MAPGRKPRTTSNLPQIATVFPLDGALLLPRAPLPLNIFEPRYLNMIDDALAADRTIAMVQTRDDDEAAEKPALQDIGCLGRITQFAETPDGRYLITLTGVCRLRIAEEVEVTTPYRQVQADYEPFASDLIAAPTPDSFDRETFLSVLKQYLSANNLSTEWDAIEKAPMELLVNSLSITCPFSAAEKQALLEADTVADRGDALATLMRMSAASGGADMGGGLQ